MGTGAPAATINHPAIPRPRRLCASLSPFIRLLSWVCLEGFCIDIPRNAFLTFAYKPTFFSTPTTSLTPSLLFLQL